MSHGPSFLKRFCLASRKRFFLCWLPEDFKEHSDEVIVEQAPQPPKSEVCDVAENISINERTDENIEAQSPASSCGTCFFDPDEVPERWACHTPLSLTMLDQAFRTLNR
jgi:hypothetical protein